MKFAHQTSIIEQNSSSRLMVILMDSKIASNRRWDRLSRLWIKYFFPNRAPSRMSLMQARRDYAPALETQELFIIQWTVI